LSNLEQLRAEKKGKEINKPTTSVEDSKRKLSKTVAELE